MNYLEQYRRMVLVRALETQLLELAKTTGAISDLHLNKGEEAVSIGITSVLQSSDYIVTSHRMISHYIGKGGNLQRLVDELLGRSTGAAGGNASEMQMQDPSIGFMFAFQTVGTQTPVAVGIAWASRYVLKEDKVVVLFTGDASTSHAQFLEGLNAAALRKVPLLIAITNNKLAGNITQDYYIPEGTTISDRLAAFGIESTLIDGDKIDRVVTSAAKLIEDVRTKSKPMALVCDVERLADHKIGQKSIRTPEEITELAKRDPIPYAERLLGLSPEQIAAVKADADATVTKAIEKAHTAPWPEPDAALLQRGVNHQ